MPIFEFRCLDCQKKFEEILSKLPAAKPESKPGQNSVPCRFCHSLKTEKIVSVFRVSGRGDLRESTLHGCHDHDLTDHDHSHD